MTQSVKIDGSFGEGGGQILRTSLTLSALTGRPLQLDQIRAGRGKPGLLRQHLTCVRAMAEICAADVSGDALGSRKLTFRPRAARAGEYRFQVGSAGSAVLVCQTVLPVLASAAGASRVVVEGGTHNPAAPPFDFLTAVYLPAARAIGLDVCAELHSYGFYPAGGGSFEVRLGAERDLRKYERCASRRVVGVRARIVSAQLPPAVAERERRVLCDRLELDPAAVAVDRVASRGPGNAVCVAVEGIDSDERDVTELFTAFGSRGVRAERVASEAATQALTYTATDAPVGEHLADQLITLLALAGGRFRTARLSTHAQTNLTTVNRFLGDGVAVAEAAPSGTLVNVRPE